MAAKHLTTAIVCAAAGALALGACDDPETDSFRMDGGASPNPTGVVEGTVLYVGPPPVCDDEGRIVGNVVLTLFDFENPPPPAGSATSALSLLTVPGEALFAPSDCNAAPPVMRSASFTWPELELGHGACVEEDGERVCPGASYQIRGFYDRDGDFLPFFGVRNLPTAGDIAGGAFVSTANPGVFFEIAFDNSAERADGQLISGVAVTLGAPITTERGIFEVADTTQALDSTALLPGGTDAIAREQQLWELSRMHVNAIVSADQEEPTEAWLAALAAGGIDSTNYRYGVPQYGFPVRPVDADGNGEQDLHPILGPAGIEWYLPIIILRRARTPIEQALGLPDVLTVGTIRPTLRDLLTPPKDTLLGFDVVVPPVTVMVTNPAEPLLCRVPMVPPGNLQQFYERIPTDCQELATGNYDVNVLSGLAGATFFDERIECIPRCMLDGFDEPTCATVCGESVPNRTDTGWVYEGGSFSSQAWTVPNDLGCPDVNYRANAVNQLDPVRPDGTLPVCGDDDSLMLASQSRGGGFSIVDGQPDDAREDSGEPGHGLEGCTEDPTGETIEYLPMIPSCCPPALDVFCGLPLCPLRNAVEVEGYPEAVRARADGETMTREIRVEGEDYEVQDDGSIRPLCTPFFMPSGCCSAD